MPRGRRPDRIPARCCPLCADLPQPHSHFDPLLWEEVRIAALKRAEDARREAEVARKHLASIGGTAVA